MTAVLRPILDEVGVPIDAVAVPITCPECGGGVEEVQPGTSGPVIAHFVLKCRRKACRREWVLVTELVAVNSRGAYGGHR